jgi:hypothetical protein
MQEDNHVTEIVEHVLQTHCNIKFSWKMEANENYVDGEVKN